MKRRKFLNQATGAALGTAAGAKVLANEASGSVSVPAKEASSSAYPLAIATSNFCGPQFVGMWRDLKWHRRLTDIIHASAVDEGLNQSPLAIRMKQMANKY